MFDMLSNAVSKVFNKGESSLSIPIMDGALKPNNLLEAAPVFAEHEGFEDIAIGRDGRIYAACGSDVVEVSANGELGIVATYQHPVTALAVLADGALAVALGGTVVIGSDPKKHETVNHADGKALTAITALHGEADGSLLICDASATHPCSDWRRDLLEKGKTGRLVRYNRSTGASKAIVSGLEYAFGALVDDRNRVLVSESWRHRISLAEGGRPVPGIPALPGYPARMAMASGGGFWLSLFACRTQLMEFVLRENDYRREMMSTIEPKYWVAPAFSSGGDFREPLQAGAVKQMGILKPWAPPRSYGLVVRFNSDFIPVYSLHSRVGGRHHGIVAIAERGDDLFILSKGSGRILRLSLSELEVDGTREANL